jgi:hypothetical protein
MYGIRHLTGLFCEDGATLPLQKEGSLDRFIQDRDIQRYRQLLERVTDETQNCC